MQIVQPRRSYLRRCFLVLCVVVLGPLYPLAGIASAQEPPVQEEPELTYTYNEETGRWDSEKWQYNPQTGQYEAPPQPMMQAPPTPTIIEPEPAPLKESPEPEVSEETTAQLKKEVKTDATLTNEIISDAVTGDATVAENLRAGNATTGDAHVDATLVNMVNSTLSGGPNQKVAQFTEDIIGDVKGDIILYPMLLKAMLEAEATMQIDTDISLDEDLSIHNDIVLDAKSGDATVAKNTVAGDATTGSATAVANVVNILNSMIASQESFIGTMNIYGNLEGDILVAPDFIPQMLAHNSEQAGDVQVSQRDTQTIVNDIQAVAKSGAAKVFDNTEAGDATTGEALSNVVIFNISGHDIIASNSMLVFVNVLGKWVGMIVDAPQGATAALIGNGVSSHQQQAADLTVDVESDKMITNTIAINAETGDATVSRNTRAGNASTGNATAMANVANVTNSQLGLTGWFGVLFINVFQNWYGSFGINTPYGDVPQSVPISQQPVPPTGPIQFVPASTTNTWTLEGVDQAIIYDSRTTVPLEPLVVVNETLHEMSQQQEVGELARSEVLGDTVQAPTFDYRVWIVAGSLLLIGLSIAGIRALLR